MVHIQAAQKISDAREPYSFACYGDARQLSPHSASRQVNPAIRDTETVGGVRPRSAHSSAPGPRDCLQGGVGEIQGIQVVDAHAVKQGCGKDIHPFGDFVMEVAHDLRS